MRKREGEGNRNPWRGSTTECVFFIGSDGSITRPRALHLIESTAEVHVVYSFAQYRRLSFDYNIKLMALTQHKVNAHAVGHVLQLCFSDDVNSVLTVTLSLVLLVTNRVSF